MPSKLLTNLKQHQTDEVLHLGRTVPFDLFMERKVRVRDLLKFVFCRHDAYQSALGMLRIEYFLYPYQILFYDAKFSGSAQLNLP
ncbi:hypothetical protein FV226_23535 [Methylobacterium sp. WL12]|uniref:hypothetical protein n=1 Tax=Methylobacterium sp. WL12 TaxID=2603890 RepID=UPI0011C923FE|nr:hypothetical protein [Methylobacterium sp. WL12]TXM66465.1 hypothetical protein FV226_23535 [Methylobacterium sp. WL12]